MSTSVAPTRGRRARVRGLGYVEILVATAFASVALLSYAAGALQEHRATQAQESRSVALQTARRFLERMRADPDWIGLYARLLAKVQDTPATYDLPITAYYPDFVVPAILGEARARVEVPVANGPDPLDPLGAALVPALRENQDAPRFGLPYDLNGDGVVDGDPRDLDYRALPILLAFRFKPVGGIAQELRVQTWLTGER